MAAGSGFLGEEGEEAGKEQRARGGRTCRSLRRRTRACGWTAYRPALVSIQTRLQIDSGVSFIILLKSKQLPSPPAVLSGRASALNTSFLHQLPVVSRGQRPPLRDHVRIEYGGDPVQVGLVAQNGLEGGPP